MVISELKCVFVHIPRCAGTTIERFFDPSTEHIQDISEHERFVGWSDKHQMWMQHATMQQLNELHEEDLDDYFKFAFVRNPWDRAISDFFWCNNEAIYLGINTSNLFIDYLKQKNGYEKLFNTNSAFTDRGNHQHTQYSFIYDSITGSKLVDFVGRYESLREDFNFICSNLSIDTNKLTVCNEFKHKHYTKYYDEETKEIVAEKYAKDIEFFGYKF
tara:strand:- start:43 stop:690 length:648 start_codon:yes stop_codon:yes gene_type:complete